MRWLCLPGTAEETAIQRSCILHMSSVIRAAPRTLSINDVTRNKLVKTIFNLLFADLLNSNTYAVFVNLLHSYE